MGVYQQEQDNMVRWDRRLRPFYEVYYLKFNFLESPRALWLRYTLLAPKKNLGSPTAAVWAIFYDHEDPKKNFAVKETVNIEETTIDREIFYFQIRECALFNSGARGKLSLGGHQLSWELQYNPQEESFKPYPPLFYYLPFPKTKLLAPNWSVQVSGEIQLDGKNVPVKACPGSQAHFWGSRHGERWAWAHCNTFHEDEGAVLEALTTQVRIAGKLLKPFTLFSLKLGNGRFFPFNRLSQWIFSRSHYGLGQWELSGQRGHIRVRIKIQNDLSDLLGITYTDTDGSKLYCYHCELANFEVEVYEQRGGEFRLTQTLNSHLAGAFEVVERVPFPGIPLQI